MKQLYGDRSFDDGWAPRRGSGDHDPARPWPRRGPRPLDSASAASTDEVASTSADCSRENTTNYVASSRHLVLSTQPIRHVLDAFPRYVLSQQQPRIGGRRGCFFPSLPPFPSFLFPSLFPRRIGPSSPANYLGRSAVGSPSG